MEHDFEFIGSGVFASWFPNRENPNERVLVSTTHAREHNNTCDVECDDGPIIACRKECKDEAVIEHCTGASKEVIYDDFPILSRAFDEDFITLVVTVTPVVNDNYLNLVKSTYEYVLDDTTYPIGETNTVHSPSVQSLILYFNSWWDSPTKKVPCEGVERCDRHLDVDWVLWSGEIIPALEAHRRGQSLDE